MYRLGIIEESLASKDVLENLAPYLFAQRVEEVPGDTAPLWHTNEYHVPEAVLAGLLPELEKQVLPTWYIHAFSEEHLLVVLAGRSFSLARERDEGWAEMIAYGESVQVERRYLENIPLYI